MPVYINGKNISVQEKAPIQPPSERKGNKFVKDVKEGFMMPVEGVSGETGKKLLGMSPWLLGAGALGAGAIGGLMYGKRRLENLADRHDKRKDDIRVMNPDMRGNMRRGLFSSK